MIDWTTEHCIPVNRLNLTSRSRQHVISPLIWFLLCDSATGQPYKETSATKVSVSSSADVDDFRDAVIEKFEKRKSSVLTGFASSQLLVYRNKAAFDKRNDANDKALPLAANFPIDGLGVSMEEAVVVVVPSGNNLLFVLNGLAKGGNIVDNDITRGLENMRLQSNVKRLELDPWPSEAASAFVASKKNIPKNVGINTCIPVQFGIPEIVKSIENIQASASELKQAEFAIERGMYLSMYTESTPEAGTNRDGVHNNCHKALSLFFSKIKCAIHQNVKLDVFGANVGPVIGFSRADMIISSGKEKDIPLIVCEFKSTHISPLEQYGQAVVSASNIAMLHHSLGISTEKIIVPIILTNGLLYQFGYVTVLRDCFPIARLSTAVLDSVNSREEIAKQLIILRKYVSRFMDQCHFNPTKSILIQNPSISLSDYYLKNVNNLFLRENDFGSSFHYLVKIWNALADMEEAITPLGFAVINAKKRPALLENNVVVFPHVDSTFHVGVPGTRAELELFIITMKKVLDRMHERGVIHVDLYPSNVFWAMGDDRHMQVRLIDFDASTFKDDVFTQEMVLRLTDDEMYWMDPSKTACEKNDYWFLFVLSNLNDNEVEAMATHVASAENYHSKQNSIYKKAIARIRNDFSKSEINDKFIEWIKKST